MNYDESALQIVREDRLLINRYDDWLFDEFKPYVGRRILEVGCGLGNLLIHFTDRELVVGIEPSDDVVRQVRDRFAQYPNIVVMSLGITDSQVLELADKQLDTVISLNVFEHIEDDILALKNTFHLLRPGGKLILIVPAHQQLYGQIDRSIGHYRRYTKTSMKFTVEQAGFTILTQKYINILGALGWWVNSRLLQRHVPPSGQLRLFNSLVPALRWFEKIIPTPFGISLLTVALKP